MGAAARGLSAAELRSYLHPDEAAAKQRTLILRIIRTTFFILIGTFTMLAFFRITEAPNTEGLAVRWWIPLVAALLLYGGAVAIDLLTPNKKIATITGVLVGVIAGMLATLALGFVIDLVVESWITDARALLDLKPAVNSIKVLIGLTFSYLGVTTVLQTGDDFRLVIPYVEFAKQMRGPRPLLLDTSILVDARIADVAATGFIQQPLIVPSFVVSELQSLSDSVDAMKRAKGRRGLETISRLQRTPRLDITIDEVRVRGKAVDQMLIEVASEMPAVLVTADLALARIAAIQNVPTLNLNELAGALKSSLIPGEAVTVRLIRQGEQAGQGVGYLADGTMVVAEDGAAAVGTTVTLTVTSSLQTAGGRLIFARLGASAEAVDQAPVAQPAAPAAEQPATPSLPAESVAPAASAAPTTPAQGPENDPARGPRTPFPPKSPRSIRNGTPRNPRR